MISSTVPSSKYRTLSSRHMFASVMGAGRADASAWLGGLKNRPRQLGAPLGRITGGTRIDEIVLPDRTNQAQRLRSHVDAKGTIRLLQVGKCTVMHRDGDLSGGHDQRRHPTNGRHRAREGNKHGDFPPLIVKQLARKQTTARTRR